MLSSVLHSERAIQINILIMRSFVSLKKTLVSHKTILQKLAELEQRANHHDKSIDEILEAIRSLIVAEEKPRRKIGFHP